MKKLTEYLTEAKKLSSYSNYELACELWDEWSGLYNGAGGFSSNSRAQRLENEIRNRGVNYDGSHWILRLQEFLTTKLNHQSLGRRRIDVMNWAKQTQKLAHDIIKQNLDDIYANKIIEVDNINYRE